MIYKFAKYYQSLMLSPVGSIFNQNFCGFAECMYENFPKYPPLGRGADILDSFPFSYIGF
jgi:hypothetical protein